MSNNLSFDLSSVPRDWLVIPCGVFFKEKSIKNTEGEMNLSVYRDYGVIPKDSRDDNHNRVSEDTSNYKLVEPGDFVLNKMKGWSGSLGVSDYRGIVSPSYTVLEPVREIHNRYFHYLLRSETYRQMYESLSYGVRIGQWELRYHDFKQIPSLYPPIEEQQLISRYLDKKTNQIASLIEKVQKKIELLKEQRTSLINHYVTKGLDPNVELKDSGIDWIGDIPKHWEVTPMFCLFSENKVKNKDGRLDVLTLSYGKIKYRDLSKLEGLLPETFDGYQVMEPQSIIIRSTDLQNDHKSLRVGHVGINGVITSAYLGLNPIKDVDTNFYYYSIHLADLKKVLYGLGGGLRQSLRFDDFKRFPILNPPQKEREEISGRLDSIDRKVNNLISKLEKRVGLLNEYRQTIISSVVTGKVRVTEDMI